MHALQLREPVLELQQQQQQLAEALPWLRAASELGAELTPAARALLSQASAEELALLRELQGQEGADSWGGAEGGSSSGAESWGGEEEEEEQAALAQAAVNEDGLEMGLGGALAYDGSKPFVPTELRGSAAGGSAEASASKAAAQPETTLESSKKRYAARYAARSSTGEF
jgi:hypothetical protein